MVNPSAAPGVIAADAPAPDEAGTPAVDQLLNGRYRLLELLGRGGMGVVYRAHDSHEGREVALKMMRRGAFDTSSVALFKAEFRTLSTLRHPHIARVYDFAACSESLDYFFTMELVAGAHAVPATEHASFERILDLIVQVARALSYLHSRNIVHLDLKPANILITPDFRVKVVDFGIARSQDLARGGVYGTPRYMAPELLLDGGEVDRRADLFGLGVTLFQLLFRRLPSVAPSEAPFLTFADEPYWLDQEVARVPAWLRMLLRRLMARTPAERYRTASEVIAAIDHGRGTHVELETSETSDSYVASARLVGLDSTLREVIATLQQRLLPATSRSVGAGEEPVQQRGLPPVSASQGDETFIDTREQPPPGTDTETRRITRDPVSTARPVRGEASDGQGGADSVFVLLCVGPEGSGKSRVLGEVRLECQLSRCRFAQAACVPDAAEPFGVWAGIANQLRTSSDFPAANRRARDALAAGAEPMGEAAVWAAELSDLLSAQRGPCLVVLDDLHWIDLRSLEVFELLLENLSQNRSGRVASVTFLCATRDELSEERASSLARVQRLGLSRQVRFPALSAEQVGELITSMLGSVALPARLPEAIARATGGNALQVTELLRAWVTDGTVQPGAAGWTFLGPDGADEVARRIHRLFHDELQTLSPRQLELLQLLAAFGEPAQLELLQGLLGLEREGVLANVDALRARRIAFMARGDLLCFSASRWRSSVLATLTTEGAAALHRRIARCLESGQSGDSVAVFYQKGGELGLAAECFARGAEEWLAQGDLRRAVRCFQRAAACGASDCTLGRACSAAAEASRLLGDRAQAATLAQRALELLPTGSPAWMRASRVAIAAFNPAPAVR